MLGARHVVKLHEWVDPNNVAYGTPGVVVLDNFRRVMFTHDASFVAPTKKVTKNDFPSSDYDSYTVEYSYPSGTEPDLTALTIDAIRLAAVADIKTALGNPAELDGALTDPSAY
jgi:hypothetical protein